MAATVTLSSDALDLEPGAVGTCEIAVTNTGRLVDQFTIGLVGGHEEWVTVEPSTLNLMPSASGRAQLRFAPPRGPELTAGTYEFGVRVTSREDPDASVVEEGRVEVAPYHEIVTELVPSKRRARRRAKFRLAVDNLGNTEAPVQIALRDPDDELVLRTGHPVAVTKPGTATMVKLTAAPRRRFWRGQPKLLPFEVITTSTGTDAVTNSGVVQQEQLIPKWLLPALAAFAVLVVAVVAGWFALLKPAVQSVATEQSRQQVAKAESAASKASGAADQASGAASQATAAATVAQLAAGITSPSAGATGGVKPSASPPRRPTPAPPAPSASGAPGPVSFRVATEAKVVADGSFQTFSYQAPPKRSLQIADLVLQNPRGDSGILRISIGKDVVLEIGLANFRDLDYHYLEPLTVAAGQPVVVSVNCTAPGAGSARCTPSVSFSGKLV